MIWKPPFRTYLAVVGLLLANELLSFASFHEPALGRAVFVLLILTAAIVSWRRFELGLLVLFAELFVGGKGYLFSLPIGSNRLSIRIALFTILLIIGLIRRPNDWRRWPSLSNRVLRWMLILTLILTLGVVLGFLHGHPPTAVYLDANAFLFALLIVVLARRTLNWAWFLPRLMAVMAAAVTVVGLKSLVALGLFVHLKLDPLRELYRWIRDTGVGEVAPIFGGTYRVFFQSQIYGLLATAVLAPLLLPGTTSGRRPWWVLLPITLGVSAIIVSLSRSFWIGSAAALVVATWVGLRWFRWTIRQIIGIGVVGLGVVGLAFTLNSWALNFPSPFPPAGGPAANQLLTQRFTELGGGAAAKSRLELLRALLPAIGRSPIVGSGFGASITYQSSDPRQLAAPTHGRYTTYAFELGYLDFAYKVGLLGLAVAIGLLVAVATDLVRRRTALTFGFLAGLAGLAAIHATTPYLNHPLGIAFVLLAIVVGSTIPETQP